MPLCRLFRLFVTWLVVPAVLGLLGSCGQSWAHAPLEPGVEDASDSAPRFRGGDADAPSGWQRAPTPESPEFAWPALPIIAAILALVWWRPRVVAAVVLVLLLVVFAFEDALHSVHHGIDQAQASACPVAAASAHLHATPVDGVAPCGVILPADGFAIEMSASEPILSLASPQQGRAPPRLRV
jgi:hypothetical protein